MMKPKRRQQLLLVSLVLMLVGISGMTTAFFLDHNNGKTLALAIVFALPAGALFVYNYRRLSKEAKARAGDTDE